MRRAIWPVVTVILVAASFGAGRLGGRTRTLPEMVAILPGEEIGFSREFDDRIRARFPVGSSEDDLIAYLVSEKFEPSSRRRDEVNATALILNGLICEKIIRVTWRADASGVLTSVGGAYESHCL